jgi:hypothetical protein
MYTGSFAEALELLSREDGAMTPREVIEVGADDETDVLNAHPIDALMHGAAAIPLARPGRIAPCRHQSSCKMLARSTVGR